MKQVAVIGDIHGCYKTFLELLKKIPEGDTIVSVGDLIDRGPNSCAVVQYMIDHPEILVVKANHEDMMITDQNGTTEYPGGWMANGGLQTMDSYTDPDGDLNKELLDKHLKWMEKLPLYLEFQDVYIEQDLDHGRKRHLVVSHASVGSTWKHRNNKDSFHWFEHAALWNRDIPSDCPDIYNIYGHTPMYEPKVKSFFANIDTGCVFNREGYDKLTALRFPSLEIIQQINIDK